MTGLSRTLSVRLVDFRRHVENLLASLGDEGVSPSRVVGDLRADAYGHDTRLIRPVLEGVGISRFVEDDGSSSHPEDRELSDADRFVLPAARLYGVDNGNGFTSFTGTVVNVKEVPAGQRVSYGYTYSTTTDSTLALVALGYADGAVRRASNLAPVCVAGTTGIIAGRVAMDQLVVDLGAGAAARSVRVGDTAVMWGDPESGHPSLIEWSRITGVPPLALTSGVGFRVARIGATS